MKKYSKLILRIHGTVVILVGTILTVGGWIGWQSGTGVMNMLQAQPIGYIGLFQAYLLMATLGVALWVGSFTENTRPWHVIGFLAHLSPFAANIIFWDMITEYGISHSGIILHIVFMLIQSVAFVFYHRLNAKETHNE